MADQSPSTGRSTPLWAQLTLDEISFGSTPRRLTARDTLRWKRLEEGELAVLLDIVRSAVSPAFLDDPLIITALKSLYLRAASPVRGPETSKAQALLRRIGASIGRPLGRRRSTTPEEFARLDERLRQIASRVCEYAERFGRRKGRVRRARSDDRPRPQVYPAFTYDIGIGKFPLAERQRIWSEALHARFLPGLREAQRGADPAAMAIARGHGRKRPRDGLCVMRVTWTGGGSQGPSRAIEYRMRRPNDPIYGKLGHPVTNFLEFEFVLTTDHITRLEEGSLSPEEWANGNVRTLYGVGEEQAKKLRIEGRKRLGLPPRQRRARRQPNQEGEPPTQV